MVIKKDFVERRKQNRLKVKEGALVEFHKPRFFSLGKLRIAYSAAIIDISLEGLSFQYIDRDMWSPKFNKLSISNSETVDEIKIDKVSFKAVSDFPISRLSNFTFKRRCGIKFGKLTLNQKHQLQHFIQNYAA